MCKKETEFSNHLSKNKTLKEKMFCSSQSSLAIFLVSEIQLLYGYWEVGVAASSI